MTGQRQLFDNIGPSTVNSLDLSVLSTLNPNSLNPVFASIDNLHPNDVMVGPGLWTRSTGTASRTTPDQDPSEERCAVVVQRMFEPAT